MVTSVTNNGARPPSHDRIVVIAGEISNAFITNRIELCQDDPDDDDFIEEDEIELVSILESLAIVARQEYVIASKSIVAIFDSLASHYAEESARVASSHTDLGAKFTFLVYVIGAFLSSRTINSDEQDVIDGELIGKVLSLMLANQSLVDRGGGQYKSLRLDVALIYFFQMFRRSYIGDQTLRSSKLYDSLAEQFQLNSVPMILDVIVQKLMANLKFWPDKKLLIAKSLVLFSDISSGYSSVKLLRKTDTALFLVGHHTAEYFEFLNYPCNKRARIDYYAAIGRLHLTNEDTQEQEFFEIVKPFGVILDDLLKVNDLKVFRSFECQKVIDGLFRDMRYQKANLVDSCLHFKTRNSLCFISIGSFRTFLYSESVFKRISIIIPV